MKISRWGFVQLKLKPCKDACMVFSAKQGNTLTWDYWFWTFVESSVDTTLYS